MFAEQASRLLEERWKIKDFERPDFIIEGPQSKFGLEVTENFIGSVTKKGSFLARGEADRNRKLQNLKKKCLEKFPYVAGWSVNYVSLNGDISERGMFDWLATHSYGDSIPESSIELFDFLPRSRIRQLVARIYISDGYSTDWHYVNDTCGWVHVANENFQTRIDEKAIQVPTYKKVISDIRLLVVADALQNSQKASITPEFIPEFRGFNTIYYLYNPVWIRKFSSDDFPIS